MLTLSKTVAHAVTDAGMSEQRNASWVDLGELILIRINLVAFGHNVKYLNGLASWLGQVG
jgi:hypothetical protein